MFDFPAATDFFKVTLKERYEKQQKTCVPRWIMVPFERRHQLKAGMFVRRYVKVGNSGKVSMQEFWLDSDIFLTEGYNGKTTECYLYHPPPGPVPSSKMGERKGFVKDSKNIGGRSGFVQDLFMDEVWILVLTGC